MRNNAAAAVIDNASADFMPGEQDELAHTEAAIARSRILRRWWKDTTGKWDGILDQKRLDELLKAKVYQHSERLTRISDKLPDNLSYAFEHSCVLDGQVKTVTGLVCQVLFDRPVYHLATEVLQETLPDDMPRVEKGRTTLVESFRRELYEFFNRHLLRYSYYASALAPAVDSGQRPVDGYLEPVNFNPKNIALIKGIVFRQLFYKKASGEVGKFRLPDRDDLSVDKLRDKNRYQWVILSRGVQQPTFVLAPFGREQPYFVIPRSENRLVAVAPDFFSHEENPGSGLLDRYVMAYALLDGTGFEEIHFLLREDASITARFVSVRTSGRHPLSGIFPNPVDVGLNLFDNISLRVMSPLVQSVRRNLKSSGFSNWFEPLPILVDTANRLTNGLAGRRLGISQKGLARQNSLRNAAEVMIALFEVSLVWRQAKTWTSKEGRPDWRNVFLQEEESR